MSFMLLSYKLCAWQVVKNITIPEPFLGECVMFLTTWFGDRCLNERKNFVWRDNNEKEKLTALAAHALLKTD